ncbi:MAG: hypothetical protein ABIF77_20175, partial [bacterium]
MRLDHRLPTLLIVLMFVAPGQATSAGRTDGGGESGWSNFEGIYPEPAFGITGQDTLEFYTFEFGSSGWVTTGLWEIGTPSNVDPPGEACVGTEIHGNYPATSSGRAYFEYTLPDTNSTEERIYLDY